MAKRRKSTHRRRARHNPKRARSFRRNPPRFSIKGIAGTAIQGVKDAAALTVGEMATNFVSRMVPVASPIPALAVRAAVAIAAGVAATQVLGQNIGRMVLAGGLSVPLKSAVRAAKIDVLTGALSSDEDITRFYRAIGSYPSPRRVAARGVGMYPLSRAPGVGDMAMPQLFAATGGGNGYY